MTARRKPPGGLQVHRTRQARNYVVLPNECVRRTDLSYCARGVLHELLSYPPGWHVSADQMAARLTGVRDGRAAIRRAMQELEDAGYLRRVHTRGGIRQEVFDIPQPASGSHLPASAVTSGNTAPEPDGRSHLPATAVTCGNSASAQVTAEATRPAAARPAPIRSTDRRGAADAAGASPRGNDKKPAGWCGQCDPVTRQIGDPPSRCRTCHPRRGEPLVTIAAAP